MALKRTFRNRLFLEFCCRSKTSLTSPRHVAFCAEKLLSLDYDCFYAACYEVEDPHLRSLPLAVQQKQIIVTCNYEARRRGLYKLQLVTEAREKCPDVIIVLGEDLTKFRDHSKDLYAFLRQQIWSGRAEKLGFDEVWLDVTDMVDYNTALLNPNDTQHSWFCLDRDDPTKGFEFDASSHKGYTCPKRSTDGSRVSLEGSDKILESRLYLGSHLASYLGDMLFRDKGFTSTVGISTNKELSKLAGNVHKPMAQTTLIAPYSSVSDRQGNVNLFLDSHEIGQVPGVGHKGAAQIRNLVRGHEVGYKEGLVTKFTEDPVLIAEVRSYPGMGPELLEETLSGPGAPRGIGGKTWNLLHGVDESEVEKASDFPKQISIEDTYLHVQDIPSMRKQLNLLSASLIRRLRTDLTSDDMEDMEVSLGSDRASVPIQSQVSGPYVSGSDAQVKRCWIAHPRTIRLSIRERKTQRSFGRTSRSGSMPNFVFSLQSPSEAIAAKLTDDCLLPMFSKLIPTKTKFDVFLINVAATNLQEVAGQKSGSEGRDISKMFKTQDKLLSEWRVVDRDSPPDQVRKAVPETECGQGATATSLTVTTGQPGGHGVLRPAVSAIGREPSESLTASKVGGATGPGSEDSLFPASQNSINTVSDGDPTSSEDVWDNGGGDMLTAVHNAQVCSQCGALMPSFALEAHLRFHLEPD